MSVDRTQHVIDAIDGALDDWSISGDAMRWTPEPDGSPGNDGLARSILQQERLALAVTPARALFRPDGGEWTEIGYLVDDVGFSFRPDPEHVAAIAEHLGQAVCAYTEWAERAAELVGMTLDQWQRNLLEVLAEDRMTAGPRPEPADPRARALELRRTRNTGPSRDLTRQRRPRRLP